jgi:hypothetical protein
MTGASEPEFRKGTVRLQRCDLLGRRLQKKTAIWKKLREKSAPASSENLYKSLQNSDRYRRSGEFQFGRGSCVQLWHLL